MIHCFDIDIAAVYGINAAILLQHLHHWIAKNKANETNFFDGHYWTYNSRKAFAELFPYMTTRQIDTALKKLIDDGLIITGNYNKTAYNRTLWYAITKEGYSMLQKCKMEETKTQNVNGENVEPIPNNIPNINTYNSKKENCIKEKNRFSPPSVEEVRSYCEERKNSVDAERFIDYYTSNGWKVGKNAMKDWRAAVRTWERSAYKSTVPDPTDGGRFAIRKPADDDYPF